MTRDRCCNVVMAPTSQVEYLLNNINNLNNFILDWLELGEKIGNMATEGELEL